MVAAPWGVWMRTSSDDDRDGGVNLERVSPHALPRWLRSSDEGGLRATPCTSTSRGALSGTMWRTRSCHAVSSHCRSATPVRQHDARQSDADIQPAIRQATGRRIASARAPDAAQVQDASTARCVTRDGSATEAPITSATAHHVSHATGWCDRLGGSRAARGACGPESLRMPAIRATLAMAASRAAQCTRSSRKSRQHDPGLVRQRSASLKAHRE